MIYQFQVINKKIFELNGNKYKRRFRLNEKDSNSVIVTDVVTGSYLGIFGIYEVRVSGKQITNWAELESVLYNSECICSLDDTDDIVGRYFDDTHELTFE